MGSELSSYSQMCYVAKIADCKGKHNGWSHFASVWSASLRNVVRLAFKMNDQVSFET